MEKIINKTMDRDDLRLPKCSGIVDELNILMKLMQDKNLRYSSWYGKFDLPYSYWVEKMNRGIYEPWEPSYDDRNIPWFLLWEISWILSNTNIKSGSTILDMGGASSLFSCYMAYKGHSVYSIDLNESLVANGNLIAEKMGWDMKCIVMDMRDLQFKDEYFDHIYSICVYEHIPISFRIEINKKIEKLLKPDGLFGLTFDYLNPSKAARISSEEDLNNQFIDPSGLQLYGNKKFFDNKKRYLQSPYYMLSFERPISYMSRMISILRGHLSVIDALNSGKAQYTFGALFLTKSGVK